MHQHVVPWCFFLKIANEVTCCEVKRGRNWSNRTYLQALTLHQLENFFQKSFSSARFTVCFEEGGEVSTQLSLLMHKWNIKHRKAVTKAWLIWYFTGCAVCGHWHTMWWTAKLQLDWLFMCLDPNLVQFFTKLGWGGKKWNTVNSVVSSQITINEKMKNIPLLYCFLEHYTELLCILSYISALNTNCQVLSIIKRKNLIWD